jgi:tetratricopeptide (TPR) repeat protein
MNESDSGQLHAAEAYLAAGNADAAIGAAKEALQRSPDDIYALDILTRGFLTKRDYRGAEATARDLVAAAPDFPGAHRLLAVAALAQEKKDLAIAEAQKAVELDPFEPANYLNLALAHELRDEFEECEAAYRKALRLSPGYTDAKARYADFLLARGRIDEARTFLEEATGEAPGDTDVIILRGTMALRDGRIDEAYENALWALQQDAMDPQAIHLMAQVKMRKNPILGIWWRYAVLMGRFTNKQQILICIGIYILWQFTYRVLLKGFPSPIPEASAILWIAFCILTWTGPAILRRMVRRELKSVEIKGF